MALLVQKCKGLYFSCQNPFCGFLNETWECSTPHTSFSPWFVSSWNGTGWYDHTQHPWYRYCLPINSLYIVRYCLQWMTTSWTYSTFQNLICIRIIIKKCIHNTMMIIIGYFEQLPPNCIHNWIPIINEWVIIISELAYNEYHNFIKRASKVRFKDYL